MVTRNWKGEVEFRFHHPWAQEVFLVGDFNGWDTAALPMARNEQGEWVCSLRLADGIYEYKYLADGAWHVEDAAAYMVLVSGADVPKPYDPSGHESHPGQNCGM